MGKQQLIVRVESELKMEVKHWVIDRHTTMNKFVVEAIKEKLLKEM